MKTVGNRWLNAVIWAFFITAIVIVGLLIFSWRDLLKIEASELLRLLTFCIGGIGAAIGLKIAIERQDKFSEQVEEQSRQVQVQSKQVQVLSQQVQVQADQSFNERLGRGVELLANEKNAVMRCAGVSILVDLANSANEAQKPIVAGIIYDFFRNRLVRRPDDDYISNYKDAENALDFLINLPLNEREKLLPNRLAGNKLDFGFLNCSYFDFIGKALENINFKNTKMKGANFSYATIKNVDFSHATIEGKANFSYATIKNVDFSHATIEGKTSFSYAKIENSIFGMAHLRYDLQMMFDHISPKDTIHDCDFSDAQMKDTTFCNMSIESTNFSSIGLLGGGFHGVEFWRGDFSFKEPYPPMGISSDSDLPHFIGTDLGDSEFQFANVLDSNKFFKFCYAPIDQERGGITTFINESRAYKNNVDLTRKFFIESDKDCSEQPVEEWVAVEIAQWKLAQAQSLSSSLRDVDADAIIEAQTELEHTIRILDYAQDALSLPKKTPQPTDIK